MNNTTPPQPPFPPVPPFAPFPPRPYPPPPPPMPYHPSIHRDSDGYTRKEVDERDAATLASAKAYTDEKVVPQSGIPRASLAEDVQESLAKADTALQEHQSLSGYATEEWVGEQGFLTEHQDITGKVDKSALFDNPDTNPMVKSALLPSYVDDVLEYASTSGFPSSGETGKIYVALDTNKTYRWGGSEYVQVGGGELPALATVATTGDYDDLINKPTIPSVPSAATATPLMDGTAAVGSGTKWAKEDHVHPTDTSRAAADSVVALSGNQTIYGNKTFSGQVKAADIIADYSYGFSGFNEYITAPENTGAALTDADIQDTNSALGSVLAAKADSSGLAAVATTGLYSDLSGLPTIPAAQVNADWNAVSGVAQILNKPTIPSTDGPFTAREEAVASQTREQTSYGKGGAATSDGEGNTWSTALPKNNGTLALQEGVAPAFSSSSTYAVGDYCTHEGLLYKCTTAVSTAGAWDSTKWTAVAVTDEMGQSTPLQFDAECEYVTVPAGAYIDPGILSYDASLGFEITFRIPASPTPGEGSFRCGSWSGATSGSFQLYINSSDQLRVCYYTSSVSNVSNAPFLGQFGTASVKGNTLSNGTASTTFSPSSSVKPPMAFYIAAVSTSTTPLACSSSVDISAASLSVFNAPLRDLVPVRVGTVGYLYDKVTGRLFGSAVPSIPLTCGPDKAVPTITTPDKLVEIDERNNYLAYASTTTLSPATAVYRATATLSGTTATMPTVTITGIPTAAAYFAFELEVAVDATATAMDKTAWDAWTWMDGGELPTADYAGKTLFIACRLDCTARTIVANCYDVR